ncbi:cyclin N-terminal domain-containing protein 1 isoform X3 [Patagioenas fasciata]|uniref:cyclin N-terminal domain-containing protein 1 isoform X3 n=1 Tax=Patagioenas fasciata TaxID=372321 RepID=UPI003A99A929
MGSPVRAGSWCGDSGPIFGEVAPEIIEDTLIHLATENEQYLSELSDQAGCFKEAQIVEFIFLLSEKWHLDQSVRYQAVELLERFMMKQIEQISSGGKVKSRDQGHGSTCRSLQDQIRDTFVLRLVSCVQLASKLSLHYNVVNSDTALKFLQSLKYSYTKQELLESELAVLKTLRFQINVSTPLAYVELLLEVLAAGLLLPHERHHLRHTVEGRHRKSDTKQAAGIQVFDSKGRFNALGCWNHQHECVCTPPWALEAGCGAFKLCHWHNFTKYLRILLRGADARPRRHHSEAAPRDKSSREQNFAS